MAEYQGALATCTAAQRGELQVLPARVGLVTSALETAREALQAEFAALVGRGARRPAKVVAALIAAQADPDAGPHSTTPPDNLLMDETAAAGVADVTTWLVKLGAAEQVGVYGKMRTEAAVAHVERLLGQANVNGELGGGRSARRQRVAATAERALFSVASRVAGLPAADTTMGLVDDATLTGQGGAASMSVCSLVQGHLQLLAAERQLCSVVLDDDVGWASCRAKLYPSVSSLVLGAVEERVKLVKDAEAKAAASEKGSGATASPHAGTAIATPTGAAVRRGSAANPAAAAAAAAAVGGGGTSTSTGSPLPSPLPSADRGVDAATIGLFLPILLDVWEALVSHYATFSGEIAGLAEEKELLARLDVLVATVRIDARRSLESLRRSVETHSGKSPVPADGTVHALASSAIGRLRRLHASRRVVESLLPAPANNRRTACGEYYVSVLAALEENLRAKAKKAASKRSPHTEALTSIFILNNFHFILNAVSDAKLLKPILAVDPSFTMRHESEVSTQLEAIGAQWKDVTRVFADLPEPSANSYSKKDRHAIKSAFESFNKTVSSLAAAHGELFVPEQGLRRRLRELVAAEVEPEYEMAFQRYGATPFTQNANKYLVYTPSSLKQLLGDLYGGRQREERLASRVVAVAAARPSALATGVIRAFDRKRRPRR
jgi:hypothetical protein